MLHNIVTYKILILTLLKIHVSAWFVKAVTLSYKSAVGKCGRKDTRESIIFIGSHEIN